MSGKRLLYLAIGVFDKGGISRYCRYQIRAMRELLGEQNVRVLSLFGSGPNDFEEEFPVDFSGRGVGIFSELRFFMESVRECMMERPAVVWSSHVRFLPNLMMLRSLAPCAALAVNVYGEELWSGRRLSLQKMLLGRAKMLVSDCHFSAEFLAREYPIAPKRLRVVWDCVDLSRFRPEQRCLAIMQLFGIPNDVGYRYVLTLGRMERRSRYKGYDRLLDALGALREHKNLIFMFAGDGDDRVRLEQRARSEGLAAQAFFLGSVPENQLVHVYNLCDVFALVSDRGYGRGEGIPLTPLEAAACGKPIIVGDEDGSRETVIDGRNGIVVSPREPEALRDALLKLLLNDELREKMGREARTIAEENFSYERFRDQTDRLLEVRMAKKL